MEKGRRVGLGLVAGAVLAASVILTTASASAGDSDSPGSITCGSVTGIVKFFPALTSSVGSAKMVAFLKLNDCTVGAGSPRRPQATRGIVPHLADFAGEATSTTQGVPLSCADLTGASGSFPVVTDWSTRWTSLRGTADTTTIFSGFVTTPGPNLTFPGSAGGATATGSYAGTDGGGSSSISLVYGLKGKCQAKEPGLKTLKIASGSFFSG
jgi:hypothetical protein